MEQRTVNITFCGETRVVDLEVLFPHAVNGRFGRTAYVFEGMGSGARSPIQKACMYLTALTQYHAGYDEEDVVVDSSGDRWLMDYTFADLGRERGFLIGWYQGVKRT